MPEFALYSADAAARTPRPYQSACVEEALKSLGQRPTLLHIATGGGKTFVANNVVAKRLEDGGYALWITKDWWLLRQAATDIAQRKHGMAQRLRRLGGNNKELEPLPSYSGGRRTAVLYTTLQTFKRRLDKRELPAEPPSLIVWDECHWGYNAPSGKALMRWASAHTIPILGLTATPRSLEDFNIACSHSFRDLVRDGFLANYNPVICRTGVSWAPRRHNNSDFTDGSLRTLSENEGRNAKIVNEYVNSARYGKTIIFACNIEHAEALAESLKSRGVACRAVHSGLQPADCEKYIKQFASSEVNVLVNVAKLTHGVSVPDIQSVFLCRPTTSDILFSQMVGRGAHAYERDTFNLVEFTDNLTKFEHVLHADEFFGSPAAGDADAQRSGSRAWRHAFDRGVEPAWTGDDVPPEVRDLWYRGQTFGVEFELTSRTWEPNDIPDDEYTRVAEGLLQHLRDRLGTNSVRAAPCEGYHEDEDFDRWKVEPDSSAGWEVVSPVLKGKDGLIELHEACAALSAAVDDDDLELCINWRCGTHAHIGWDDDHIAKALQLVHLLEPVLRSLVPPSRFAQYSPGDGSYRTDTPNEFCRPVSDVYDFDSIDEDTSVCDVASMARNDPGGGPQGGRTVGLNVTPLFDGGGHVEVRLLGGTTEARKVLPWLSLWMRILWRAERPLGDDLFALAYAREPSMAFPDLDLEEVFRKEVIGVPHDKPVLLKSLQRRQKEIFEIWRAHPELAEWIPRHRHHWELEVELWLRKIGLLIPTTHDFEELSDRAQKVAVWCTLVGEGGLPRDHAIRLSAARLRDQEWVYFDRFRENGPLHRLIQKALRGAKRPKSLGGDKWFDIPGNRQVRAFRRFDKMLDEDWRRCVVEAVKAKGGTAEREEVRRAAFEESRKRFGVEREQLRERVRGQINSAINSCIRRGHIRREGRERLVLDQ